MEKSIAAHWLALQSHFVNHTQHYIKAIIHSTELVTRRRNRIGHLKISIGKAQGSLESSDSLLRRDTASNELSTHWLSLEQHFAHHAEQVARFGTANRSSVRRMWKTQANEHGEPLSDFEREALIERHCELFGIWPR